jgi:superoxide reductase
VNEKKESYIMADRRDILKIGLGVVAGVGASQAYTMFSASKQAASESTTSGSAASGGGAPVSTPSGTLPSGIVYTAENPGKWFRKVKGHLPKIEVEGRQVTITTDHVMGEDHYIVRQTLVSEDGKVLGEKVFSPVDDDPISTFELPEGYASKLYATSFCNKHDLWIAESTVA